MTNRSPQRRCPSARALAWMLSACLVATGCVAETEYRQAVQETETARAGLQEAREQIGTLDRQLKQLEAESAMLAARAQALAEELRQVKERYATERTTMDAAVGRLHETIIALKGQNRSLQKEYDDQQRENIALAAMVQRYARELEEAREAPPVSPPPASKPATVAAPSPVTAPNTIQSNGTSSSSEAVKPVPLALKPTQATPQPPNPAPSSEEEGWLTVLKGWFLALWSLFF